jgi:hypothetical protein
VSFGVFASQRLYLVPSVTAYCYFKDYIPLVFCELEAFTYLRGENRKLLSEQCPMGSLFRESCALAWAHFVPEGQATLAHKRQANEYIQMRTCAVSHFIRCA